MAPARKSRPIPEATQNHSGGYQIGKWGPNYNILDHVQIPVQYLDGYKFSLSLFYFDGFYK
jgi:hypothetical protein